MPESMGFPATDWGSSLEAQSYYGAGQARYWLSVQGGWVDRSRLDCLLAPAAAGLW